MSAQLPKPGAADAPGVRTDATVRTHQSPFVLVVDDSPDIRELLVEVLTPTGFEVRAVSSGLRALKAMDERLPDLVICDLLMPGMSGFALRSLMLRRSELAGVPVVVLSAYWQRPSETLEVVEVLTKPIDIDQLIDTACRITGRSDSAGRASATPETGRGGP